MQTKARTVKFAFAIRLIQVSVEYLENITMIKNISQRNDNKFLLIYIGDIDFGALSLWLCVFGQYTGGKIEKATHRIAFSIL